MTQNLEYKYENPELNLSHEYLLPVVQKVIFDLKPQKIFDLGCGNGSIANKLSSIAPVSGIDASESAIGNAKATYPHLKLELRSAYDDLAAEFGTFPVVVSLEVVEHMYDPRSYARTLAGLLTPGGHAILSTPYHGYVKNLVMALTGKMDAHFTALWDGGHIKFWSRATLTTLLNEVGLEVVEFVRVGRLPPVAKSMILVARKA